MRSLLVLVLLAKAAHARPAPRPILPPVSCYLEPTVYPAPKSKNVPLDAKAWVIASELSKFDHIEYRLRWGKSERVVTVTKHEPFDIVEVDLGTLLPNQRYSLLEGSEVITTFTTGRARDQDAPEPPLIRSATVMDDLPETSYVHIDLAPDPDRVLVELRVDDHILVAPLDVVHGLGARCVRVNLLPKFCFWATAIDLTGKRSYPTMHCAQIQQGPGMEPDGDGRTYSFPVVEDPPDPWRTYPRRAALGFALAIVIGLSWIVRAQRRLAKPLA